MHINSLKIHIFKVIDVALITILTHFTTGHLLSLSSSINSQISISTRDSLYNNPLVRLMLPEKSSFTYLCPSCVGVHIKLLSRKQNVNLRRHAQRVGNI